MFMGTRTRIVGCACAVLLAACVGGARSRAAAGATRPVSEQATGGEGAAPGNAKGPGGFVSRGEARNFYAAGGGRLWYYMNNYYWAPKGVPRKGLWIKAEVTERFRDLLRWPDRAPLASPPPKETVEYWEVGATGRTTALDNHKDFLLRSDDCGAGAIEVTVTLTLGRVLLRYPKGTWGPPDDFYVLEHRTYGDDRGVGSDRTRFTPLEREPVTVWRYRIPWATFPARLTRSNWEDLDLPEWSLVERRAPPATPRPAVTTVSEPDEPAPPR